MPNGQATGGGQGGQGGNPGAGSPNNGAGGASGPSGPPNGGQGPGHPSASSTHNETQSEANESHMFRSMRLNRTIKPEPGLDDDDVRKLLGTFLERRGNRAILDPKRVQEGEKHFHKFFPGDLAQALIAAEMAALISGESEADVRRNMGEIFKAHVMANPGGINGMLAAVNTAVEPQLNFRADTVEECVEALVKAGKFKTALQRQAVFQVLQNNIISDELKQDMDAKFPDLIAEAEGAQFEEFGEKLRSSWMKEMREGTEKIVDFVEPIQRFGQHISLTAQRKRDLLHLTARTRYDGDLYRRTGIGQPIQYYLRVAKSFIEESRLSKEGAYDVLLLLTSGAVYDRIAIRKELKSDFNDTWRMLQVAETADFVEEKINANLERLVTEPPMNLENTINSILLMSTRLYCKEKDEELKVKLSVVNARKFIERLLVKFYPNYHASVLSEVERMLTVSPLDRNQIGEIDLIIDQCRKIIKRAPAVRKVPARHVMELAPAGNVMQTAQEALEAATVEEYQAGNNEGWSQAPKCHLCSNPGHFWRQCSFYPNQVPGDVTCRICKGKHPPVPCKATAQRQNPNNAMINQFNGNNVSIKETMMYPNSDDQSGSQQMTPGVEAFFDDGSEDEDDGV